MDQQQQQQQQQQHEHHFGNSAKETKHHRCDSDRGEEPRPKTRKLSQPDTDLQLQFQLLPDEVLVHIGESVAKLCGIRDFVRLSRTSKHLKKLLIDSEETVSNVIRIRTSRIDHSTNLLPSFSSSSIVIRTLKQLRFYEHCCGYNCYYFDEGMQQHHSLLERSHIDFENNAFTGDNCHTNIHLVSAVSLILEKNPSAYVVLDAHCSIRPGFLGEEWSSENLGNRVGAAIGNFRLHKILKNRVRIRPWGRKVASAASTSEHPYADMVKKGGGWVEIFLRMGPDDPSAMLLELPPRPDFYQNVTLPEEIVYKNDDQ